MMDMTCLLQKTQYRDEIKLGNILCENMAVPVSVSRVMQQEGSTELVGEETPQQVQSGLGRGGCCSPERSSPEELHEVSWMKDRAPEESRSPTELYQVILPCPGGNSMQFELDDLKDLLDDDFDIDEELPTVPASQVLQGLLMLSETPDLGSRVASGTAMLESRALGLWVRQWLGVGWESGVGVTAANTLAAMLGPGGCLGSFPGVDLIT
ncbi:hypothetical protein BTVI_81003 [Pitangus sulphuratus]|nr:hypothetical protein BTVI_81003 [Pitangus sulphuratus]